MNRRRPPSTGVPQPPSVLDGIDHGALAVRDVGRSVAWYQHVLGLERRHAAVSASRSLLRRLSGGRPIVGWQEIEAQRAGVHTHVIIDAQHDQVRSRGLCDQRACQMKRVERPERFLGKALPRAIDHFRAQPENRPMRRGRVQFAAPAGRLGLRQLAECRRANEDAIAFDEGQIRRDDQRGRRKAVTDLRRARLAEQPGKDRARFRVERQRSPRSAERSAAARPGLSAGRSRR